MVRFTVASCFGFLRVSNGVAAQQKMERQVFARRQAKDYLSHFRGVAHLMSPVRFQCGNRRADGRFVIRLAATGSGGSLRTQIAVTTLKETNYPYARGSSPRVWVTIG